MIRIYCKGNHKTTTLLCDSCKTFSEYAEARLKRCPFGEEKEACSKCPIHCYAQKERELTKIIMRYSGYKMLLRHPILSIFHFWDR